MTPHHSRRTPVTPPSLFTICHGVSLFLAPALIRFFVASLLLVYNCTQISAQMAEDRVTRLIIMAMCVFYSEALLSRFLSPGFFNHRVLYSTCTVLYNTRVC